MKIRIYTEE